MADEDQEIEAASEPRVVSGAGVAAISQDADRAARVEKAMSDAILKALDEGVTDPDEQRQRIMAARDAALQD